MRTLCYHLFPNTETLFACVLSGFFSPSSFEVGTDRVIRSWIDSWSLIISIQQDESFMRVALEQAQQAFAPR